MARSVCSHCGVGCGLILVFGEQRSATDYLYRSELEGWHGDGLLTRLSVAFSRDQRHKVYVQDLMRDTGAELWRWIDAGAHVYVCGDATHGRRTAGDAEDYLHSMTAQRRYLRDVY